jgi:hypothetical protein
MNDAGDTAHENISVKTRRSYATPRFVASWESLIDGIADRRAAKKQGNLALWNQAFLFRDVMAIPSTVPFEPA